MLDIAYPLGSPISTQRNMSWKLSCGNHVGRLLQFDDLLIHECAFVVDDDIRIHWTIFGLSVNGRATAMVTDMSLAVAMPHLLHVRLARSGQREAFQSSRYVLLCDMSAAFASNVQTDSPRRQHRGGNDNSRNANQAGD